MAKPKRSIPLRQKEARELIRYLLVATQELVRCIREGQCGDWSPMIDEVFDAEATIVETERQLRRKRIYF